MVVVVYLNDQHLMAAFRAFERIITKREKDVITPFCKAFHDTVPGRMDRLAEGTVRFPVSGINPIIACHFEMLFRDMLDQEFDEFNDGKSLFNINIIFMTVIVESDIFTIIGINTFEGNDRSSKIAADVFYNGIGITEIRFCIDIKAVFIFVVNKCFGFLERWTNVFFHFIKEGSLESFAEVSVIEISDIAPEAVIGVTAFGDEAVDMGIPLQRTSKSMEDADESGHEVFGLIQVMKHTEYNAADSRKKTVQKGTVFQKKVAEFLVNGKDTVAVSARDEFESHVSGAFLAVLDAAGRAETALAAERNKLHVATMGTCIHGSAKGRVATVDHLGDVFHFSISGMKCILNGLIVVFEYFLKDVNEIIMNQIGVKSNPPPQD